VPAMREWLRANGGWPALVFVGVTLLGLTNRWAGYAFIAFGLAGFVRQHSRLLRNPRDGLTATIDARPVELASSQHREAMREMLQSLLHPLEVGERVGMPADSMSALRAHYPELARTIARWNNVLACPVAAREALTRRFAEELHALNLSSDFNEEVLAAGLSDVTARRALTDQLGVKLPRAQLWDIHTHQVHVRGMREVAIRLPWNIRVRAEDERKRTHDPIDRVEPTFVAAQAWPEAWEISDAKRVINAFDRGAVRAEIERLVLPEKIRVAPDCPICGVIS
jgi:hypothetical protein